MKNCLLFLALTCTGINCTADTVSKIITIKATCATACSISVSNLNFGNYTGAALAGTATISLVCTNSMPYNIGLNKGGGTGASIATRKLTSGTNILNYSLYQNVNNTIVWGDVVGTNTVAGTGTGSTQTYTIYGLVPADQNVPVGTYNDIINVTVQF